MWNWLVSCATWKDVTPRSTFNAQPSNQCFMGSKDWNVSSPYLVVAQNHQNIWCCKKSWHHPHPTASTPVSRLITEEECKKSCFLKKSSAMPFGKICQRGNTVEQIDKPQPSGCRPSCDTPLKWKIARIVQIFKYICRNTKIQFTLPAITPSWTCKK